MNLETKSNEKERTEQSRARRRITLIIGGGFGLVLLGIGAGILFRAPAAQEPEASTELPTTNLPEVTERSVVRTPAQANLHILERDFRGALKVFESLPLEEMTFAVYSSGGQYLGQVVWAIAPGLWNENYLAGELAPSTGLALGGVELVLQLEPNSLRIFSIFF